MEEGNFIASSELKAMRIRDCPMKAEGSLVIDDRMEEQGTLRIHEYIGGCLYLGAGIMGQAPLVAGISVMKSGDSLKVGEMFHEHGHEDLAPLLAGMAKHFAGFYGYAISFLAEAEE